jgi:thiosulfate reductase cytochrome b subunit
VKRHALSTRLWHWASLPCVVVLFMSGLTISNAHPWLYWGDWGFAPDQAWLAVPRFPDWMTIPGYYSLAAARAWHILAAWPFALLLLFGWLAMLVNRHFARDIATSRHEWAPRAIWADVRAHLRFDFTHGTGKYNFLQKLAYGGVWGILLPGLVLTGIAISPGMAPSFNWLIELMGGRQSARSLHFLFAWGLFAFAVVHVALVLLTNPLQQIADMIGGGSSKREA